MLSNIKLLAATVLGAILLTACQSAPLSFLSGHPDRHLPNHLYPVRIVSVDQTLYFSGPVQLEPGMHRVVVELAHSGSHIPTQKTMQLDVQACTRYYIVANKTSIMESKWEPMMFDSENVGGCNPDDEMKKAHIQAAGQ
ncbi:hypothetical protein ACO0LF_16430 [Undibacterium sp. Di27W]|uniref:hypothetical protein n=1 Tax=Undibacterium sp. Di27W TaxID=3413036 RepID=UPI003BF1B5B1